MNLCESTSHRCAVATLVGFALLALPAPVRALDDGFPLERLQLPSTRDGLVGIQSGAVLPHLRTELTLWTGYSNALLSARSPHGHRAVLAGDRVGGALSASIGLFDRGEVGLVLPYLLHQQRTGNLERILDPTARLQPLAAAGIGDLQLLPRIRILDAATFGVDLSASVALAFPTGGGEAYRGNTGVTAQPAVAASRSLPHNVRVGAEVGALVRGARPVLGNLHVGSEINLGIGAAWKFGFDETTPFELQGSLTGTFGLAGGDARNQSELRVLAGWEPTENWQVFLGGGVGLWRGYGTPDWRAWSGVRFAFDSPFGRPQPVEPEPIVAPEVTPKKEPAVEPEPPAEVAESTTTLDDPVPGEPPIELELRVRFAEGSDVLSPAGKEIVERVARALSARPDLSVYVDGHSDAKGVLEMNIGLSYRRAMAVRRALEQAGIAAERLEARGFGPDRPTATNDSPEGRAENRRVEFVVRNDADPENS